MTDYIATISIGNTNKSVSLEDFKGTISVVSTWEVKDGKTRANWCFKQERKDGVNVPGDATTVKVQMGDKATAVGTLLQLLEALGWKPETAGEDIPF